MMIFVKLTIILLGVIFGLWFGSKLDQFVSQKSREFWTQTFLYCSNAFMSVSIVFGVMILGLGFGSNHTMTFGSWLFITAMSGFAFAGLRFFQIFLIALINKLFSKHKRINS